MTFVEQLKQMRACCDALEWVGDKTFAQVWKQCERADWMLWYCARILPRERVVLAACACARTALKYVPAGEHRPLRAIETAECWARGEVSLNDVRQSAAAAYAAAAATATAAAPAIATAAAYAAYAANANVAATRKSALRAMADLVRSIIKVEEFA